MTGRGTTTKQQDLWRHLRMWALSISIPATLCVLAVLVFLHVKRGDDRNEYFRTAHDPIIADAARRHGLPPLLIKAVIWKESRYRPAVRGRHGEVGLMQITEGAVVEWQRTKGHVLPPIGVCFNPHLNIEIGSWYLGRAMRYWSTYRDSDVLALAEYNAGRSRARRWAPQDPQAQVPLSAISFPSTREYIRQVRSKWHELEKEQRNREQQTSFGTSDVVAR